MIYNCHIHTFREPDVPRKFLPLGLVRILASQQGFRIMGRLLSNIHPNSDKDIFDRYVKFVKISKKHSQFKIYTDCKKSYQGKCKFIILPMDMAYMNAGDVPRPYEQQIDELAKLRDKFPDEIIPFIHIDPRRKGVMDLLRNSVEQKNFKGIKLYPPLGYYPYHPLLMDEVYPYCVEKKLPVIAHGSPFNPVRNKGSRKELCELLGRSMEDPEIKKMKRKELTSLFTHPHNYKVILEDNRFKELKICIAHFGSEYYWKKYIKNQQSESEDSNWLLIIKKMLGLYPNFYTDISFTLDKKNYYPLLKELLSDQSIRNKILLGTDYYMTETKTDECTFVEDLKDFLDADDFNQIAVVNPERFLG